MSSGYQHITNETFVDLNNSFLLPSRKPLLEAIPHLKDKHTSTSAIDSQITRGNIQRSQFNLENTLKSTQPIPFLLPSSSHDHIPKDVFNQVPYLHPMLMMLNPSVLARDVSSVNIVKGGQTSIHSSPQETISSHLPHINGCTALFCRDNISLPVLLSIATSVSLLQHPSICSGRMTISRRPEESIPHPTNDGSSQGTSSYSSQRQKANYTPQQQRQHHVWFFDATGTLPSILSSPAATGLINQIQSLKQQLIPTRKNNGSQTDIDAEVPNHQTASSIRPSHKPHSDMHDNTSDSSSDHNDRSNDDDDDGDDDDGWDEWNNLTLSSLLSQWHCSYPSSIASIESSLSNLITAIGSSQTTSLTFEQFKSQHHHGRCNDMQSHQDPLNNNMLTQDATENTDSSGTNSITNTSNVYDGTLLRSIYAPQQHTICINGMASLLFSFSLQQNNQSMAATRDKIITHLNRLVLLGCKVYYNVPLRFSHDVSSCLSSLALFNSSIRVNPTMLPTHSSTLPSTPISSLPPSVLQSYQSFYNGIPHHTSITISGMSNNSSTGALTMDINPHDSEIPMLTHTQPISLFFVHIKHQYRFHTAPSSLSPSSSSSLPLVHSMNHTYSHHRVLNAQFTLHPNLINITALPDHLIPYMPQSLSQHGPTLSQQHGSPHEQAGDHQPTDYRHYVLLLDMV